MVGDLASQLAQTYFSLWTNFVWRGAVKSGSISAKIYSDHLLNSWIKWHLR